MAKYKRERNNKTKTKSSKSNRTALKNKKRMVDKWGNPTKYNKDTNPNLALVKKTGNQMIAGKDPISKVFSTVAGGALVGGLSAVAKAKGLINVAKTIKTAGKIKKAKSVT